MRRTLIALSSLLLLACPSAPKRSDKGEAKQASGPSKQAQAEFEAEAEIETAAKPDPYPEVVRKDLVAENLPPVPTLEQLDATELASGQFDLPEGTDELAPRAALALRDGLLLAGQTYKDRRPGTPSQSWRWTGFIPHTGEPRSTHSDPGAIRAGIAIDGEGLLTGTRGIGFDVRGWFAKVRSDGTITDETALDTPSATELFDLVPGSSREKGELVVLGGYVDAQAWLISLDAGGQRRWEKYVGSYGNTQVRALARLDSGELLLVGSRAEKFGEAWFGRAPGDGGESAAGDDVTQDEIEIEGVDPNRMIRALVDLGDAGYVALGTAKLQHFQAHDQLFAIGFDRTGKVAWARAIADVRATDVLGARGHAGVAQFVVSVPLSDDPKPKQALALVRVPAEPTAPVVARRLANQDGWSSAGFIEGSAALELIAYQPSEAGIAWQRLTIAQ